MKKYKTSVAIGKIEQVEVSRETESSVWIVSRKGGKEIRHSKKSGYYNFFDTHEQAKKFLWDNIENNISRNKEDLARLLLRQEAILNLQP